MALIEKLNWSDYIDLGQKSLYVSAFSIMYNPLFWNIVARREYRKHSLSNLFGGRRQQACYFLAAIIFSIGIVRDYLYKTAIEQQPTHPLLDTLQARLAGYVLLTIGNVLVVTSTWRLGITGTFLGDYFGILMDEMVTGFPFNVTDAPMYYGSTMSFLGTAFILGKFAGVILTGWVLAVYLVALKYENPFTAGIYAKRERERKKATKKTL